MDSGEKRDNRSCKDSVQFKKKCKEVRLIW